MSTFVIGQFIDMHVSAYFNSLNSAQCREVYSFRPFFYRTTSLRERKSTKLQAGSMHTEGKAVELPREGDMMNWFDNLDLPVTLEVSS